jgi:ATP dependent DNA ligase domain
VPQAPPERDRFDRLGWNYNCGLTELVEELAEAAERHVEAEVIGRGAREVYVQDLVKLAVVLVLVCGTQPVMAAKAALRCCWVHEIKHDGYRMIVRRDGPSVRLYSRNAYDWTVRLAAIAAATAQINAGSFTIDGEAVVLGPDGLSRFEELSRREAADNRGAAGAQRKME